MQEGRRIQSGKADLNAFRGDCVRAMLAEVIAARATTPLQSIVIVRSHFWLHLTGLAHLQARHMRQTQQAMNSWFLKKIAKSWEDHFFLFFFFGCNSHNKKLAIPPSRFGNLLLCGFEMGGSSKDKFLAVSDSLAYALK
jgi:hypothetical protein